MKNPSFLTYERSLLTCMVQAEDPMRIRELVERSDGAEAFGMQFCQMKPEYRNEESYRALFSCVSPRPTYVTNYRVAYNKGKSDEELARELLTLAECGATLCDVMGDYFAPCEGELTVDDAAIRKQEALIGELHQRGAEVLMSSHVLKFTPAERVLEIALEHQRRGADISKIVVGASTMAEQIENLRIITLLRENLKIPFLFLSGGECRIMRRIGGSLGNCMSLCVCEYDQLATKAQPLLSQMKDIRSYMEEPQ